MRIPPLVLSFSILAAFAAAEPVSIRADSIGAEVAPDAAISNVTRLPDGAAFATQAQTAIAGLNPEGEAQVADVDSGGKEYTRRFSDGTHRCIVKDRFVPAGTSIRWEIEVFGEGEPWSAPIETRLQWPVNPETVFWTAWSDPLHEKGPWHDPLVFRPLDDLTFWYGAPPFDEKKPLTGYCPLEGDTFCIPLITIGEPARDEAFSVVLSPEDDLLDLTLRVDKQGGIVFSRLNYRIAPDRPLRFALDLVSHPADWRSALAWMVGRYPQYFNPPNPAADEMAGTAAYSSYEGELDVAKCMRMSFRVNWKASFDFPYMGMFLPPVANDTEKWPRFAPGETSVKQMNDYAQRMRDMGFYVLSYFNVTEFGTDIKGPEKVNADAPEGELWKNANDFLYRKIPDGVLYNESGGIWGTWGGAIAMDPAGPAYQAHLLEQARRHVAELPDASGVCIDRLDWLRFYNPREDDGLSWHNGKPMRSLFQSWKSIIAKLDPIFHDAGKVIFVNNHLKRLELLRYVDGIYCEFAHVGTALNGSGLLGLRKPVLGWTADVSNLKPDPDGFLQRYLYMGVYPTAPLAGNDHTILSDPWAEHYYMDYGKLFDAIRGKKWVLQPHVVEVADDKAKANLFEVPAGYVIPVTFGGNEPSVTVKLHNLPKREGQGILVADVIHPGEANWSPLAVNEQEGVITLDVPLQRGCAMVKLMPVPQSAGTNKAWTRLNILTWNIQMLPALEQVSEALRKMQRERLPWIVEYLTAQPFDLVCLQEVIDPEITRQLEEQLKPAYPYVVLPQFHPLGRALSSGVMFAARVPIEYVGHIAYSHSAKIDWWTSKGCTLVEGVKDGIRFQVAGTHLQAGRDEIKETQITELTEQVIKAYRKPGMPQFLVGDFNTRKELDRYTRLLQMTDMRDFPVDDPRPYTIDYTNSWKEGKDNPGHIDHILLNPGGTASTVLRQAIQRPTREYQDRTIDLSDHYGIAAETIIAN